MKDSIFKDIAVRNGITESEVRHEIECTILEACKNPDAPINSIVSGRVPTAEEVMQHVIREVEKTNMS